MPSRHCWRFEFAICSVPASKPSARSSRSAHGMSSTRPSRRGSSGCSLSASTSRPTASPSCSMPPGSVVWSLNWRAKTPLLRPRLSQSSTPPSWRRPSNDPAHGPGGRDVDHPYPHAPPAPGRSEVDHRAGGRGAVAAEAGSRRYADQGLVRAHRWRRRIESGRAKSITDLAEQEGVTDAYVCRLLPLTWLAPDIVEAILDGRQPKGLRLAEMLGNGTLGWEEQRVGWGFGPSAAAAPADA